MAERRLLGSAEFQGTHEVRKDRTKLDTNCKGLAANTAGKLSCSYAMSILSDLCLLKVLDKESAHTQDLQIMLDQNHL